MVVGFTGGRPKRFPWKDNEQDNRCIDLKAKLKNELIKLISFGADKFICGMAMGADTYFAEIIIELKAEFNIQLIAALSCSRQPMLWKEKEKKRFYNIINYCDNSYVPYINHVEGCEKLRNYYIVDNCDLLIAIDSGIKASGTAQTIAYAKKTGKKIITFFPY
ncbi:MAG: SLOG family protein [Clostridia bacterium]